MQMIVLTLTGKTVTLNVADNATVADALVAITALEQRTAAEVAAIDLMTRGLVFGGERLVVRSTGMSLGGADRVAEMRLDPQDPLVKVVVRKRMDDPLTPDDWHILQLLRGQYDRMLQGQRGNPMTVLSENPVPAVTCTVGCLRFDVQCALGRPPLLDAPGIHAGLNMQGLAFAAHVSTSPLP